MTVWKCLSAKQLKRGSIIFIIDLVNHDYLRVIMKHERVELPPNYGAHWRRYEAFYGTEIDALGFVCSAWFVPKLKLYLLEKPRITKTDSLI
jgi:hypothetical protein